MSGAGFRGGGMVKRAERIEQRGEVRQQAHPEPRSKWSGVPWESHSGRFVAG